MTLAFSSGKTVLSWFMLMTAFFLVALMQFLDTVVSDLQRDFVLTSQGSVGSYLSIDIRRTPEGHLELCQPGFINKIIAACGLQDNSFSHHTHSTMVLTADTTGLPCEHQWSYRSIIVFSLSEALGHKLKFIFSREDLAFSIKIGNGRDCAKIRLHHRFPASSLEESRKKYFFIT
jgi:hypothetical protein